MILFHRRTLFEAIGVEMEKKEIVTALLWFLGFILVYILFLPIKGDQFYHFFPVYGYLIATILLFWALYLISKPFRFNFALRMTVLILVMALIFPIASYYYNGRQKLICNAAKHNYQFILNALLDTSNQEEMSTALFCAKEGNNLIVAEDLKAKGAK